MIKRLMILTLLVVLSGCMSSLDDLNRFIENEKSKPVRPIESLPEIKPMEVFEYVAGDSRDPFSNDLAETETEADDESLTAFESGEGPDLTRRKEFLESYPLDSLLMVGTYQQKENYWGLVVDPEGTIHRVSVGHHLGHNYGKITSIAEDQIEIQEWTHDGLGAWHERSASIALKEE